MIQAQRLRLPLALLPFLFAAPAFAQDTTAPTAYDGDFLTVGVGAAYLPSYEGSNDYVVSPVPAIAGRLGGIGITPRPGGLALDFINDPKDSKFSFQAGPAARLRFDRHVQIKDPVVELLRKRNIAVEIGGNVGFSINQITNPYDSLTFSVDVRKDVGSAHQGWVISPGATFQTPLSKASYVALNVSAEHVDSKYARYYYSIGPGASAASGLPEYTARGGWKNVGGGLIGAYDLDGDLTNGGFAVFVGGNYSRVLGNFRDAPIVSLRGSPNQFTGVVGVGYTF